MKLTDQEFDLMEAIALNLTDDLKFDWGEEVTARTAEACRAQNLVRIMPDNALALTGYGAAVLVQNGYTGALNNVRPHEKPRVRVYGGRIKGSNSADKRAGV